MNDQSPWDDAFQKAEAEFSRTQAAMDAKERMFANVMKSISSNPIAEITFQQSVEQIEKIAESSRMDMAVAQNAQEGIQAVSYADGQRQDGAMTMTEVNKEAQNIYGKRRPTQPTRKSEKKPLRIGRLIAGAGAVAAAAVVATVGLNREPKPQPVNYETLDPKVAQSAIEKLTADAQGQYITIAANKHFQLGYLDGQKENDVIQVVVSANTADIDWDSFYATNQNNDLIQPLEIDKENNIITLQPTQSEIQLEISDCEGNLIECTLSDELQES